MKVMIRERRLGGEVRIMRVIRVFLFRRARFLLQPVEVVAHDPDEPKEGQRREDADHHIERGEGIKARRHHARADPGGEQRQPETRMRNSVAPMPP